MSAIVGEGNFKYEALDTWPTLPEGARLIETPGVAVDSQDEIYAFSRNPDFPVMVFDRDGNFLRGFGKGIFGNRTHGILIGPDDTVYCTDAQDHTVRKCTLDGRVLMTLGVPGKPQPYQSGLPFNRCTHVALGPLSTPARVSSSSLPSSFLAFWASAEWHL